ncbi:hypothetical protein FRC04_008580 [Tulasnella sp. 424]|nr:hypothetical protein FRC04_008580 [Tulasnella sp. 424]KAG8974051.1 hypothetical protein FRC05_007967 [Tulasnella sp. 425]
MPPARVLRLGTIAPVILGVALIQKLTADLGGKTDGPTASTPAPIQITTTIATSTSLHPSSTSNTLLFSSTTPTPFAQSGSSGDIHHPATSGPDSDINQSNHRAYTASTPSIPAFDVLNDASGKHTSSAGELDAFQGQNSAEGTERHGDSTIVTLRSSIVSYLTDVANFVRSKNNPDDCDRNDSRQCVLYPKVVFETNVEQPPHDQTAKPEAKPRSDYLLDWDFDQFWRSEDFITTLCLIIVNILVSLYELTQKRIHRELSRKHKEVLDELLQKALIVKLSAEISRYKHVIINASNELKSLNELLTKQFETANQHIENLRKSALVDLDTKTHLEDRLAQCKQDFEAAVKRESEALARVKDLKTILWLKYTKEAELSSCLATSRANVDSQKALCLRATEEALNSSWKLKQAEEDLLVARTEVEQRKEEAETVMRELQAALLELTTARTDAIASRNAEEALEAEVERLKKETDDARQKTDAVKKDAEEAFDILESSIKEQKVINDQLLQLLAERDATLAVLSQGQLDSERRVNRIPAPPTPSTSVATSDDSQVEHSPSDKGAGSQEDSAEKSQERPMTPVSPKNVPLPPSSLCFYDDDSAASSTFIGSTKHVAFSDTRGMDRNSSSSWPTPNHLNYSTSILALDLAAPALGLTSILKYQARLPHLRVGMKDCPSSEDSQTTDMVEGTDKAIASRSTSSGTDVGVRAQPQTPTPSETCPLFGFKDTPTSVIVRGLAGLHAQESLIFDNQLPANLQSNKGPLLTTFSQERHPHSPLLVHHAPAPAGPPQDPRQPSFTRWNNSSQQQPQNKGLSTRSMEPANNYPPYCPPPRFRTTHIAAYSSAQLTRVTSCPLYQPQARSLAPYALLQLPLPFDAVPVVAFGGQMGPAMPSSAEVMMAPRNMNRAQPSSYGVPAFDADWEDEDWDKICADIEHVRRVGVSPELRSPNIRIPSPVLELEIELPGLLVDLSVPRVSVDEAEVDEVFGKSKETINVPEARSVNTHLPRNGTVF